MCEEYVYLLWKNCEWNNHNIQLNVVDTDSDTATRFIVYFFHRELAAGCYGLPFNITLQKEIEAKKGI